MSLVKPGGGVTDIRGSMAGNVFARDSSGLHVRTAPRRVKQCTPAQRKQRNAFLKARQYSKDNRTVSYLIYRALNDLPFVLDAIVTGDPVPDCTGRYVLAGTYCGKDYYERTDSAYAIWIWCSKQIWIITEVVEVIAYPYWVNGFKITGDYEAGPYTAGDAIVRLQVQDPPLGYEPPRL